MTRQALSLKHNMTWTFFGNVIYAGSQWALLVLLAKLLPLEEVGRFSLALAVTMPVMRFASLSLREGQFTDAKGEFSYANYLGLRLLTTVVAMCIIAGIAFGSNYPLDTALVIIAIGLGRGFESISDIIYGLYALHERMDWLAKSIGLRGLLSLGAMGITVYFTHSILWGAVAMSAGFLFRLITFDARNGARFLTPDEGQATVSRWRALFPTHWDWHALLRLTWVSLPMALVVTLAALRPNLPRYLIERHMGLASLAIFSALAAFKAAGLTVTGAMGQAAGPRLAKYFAADDLPAYTKLLCRLVTIGLLVSVASVVLAATIGRPVLTLVYRPEYAKEHVAFVWIMGAAACEYIGSFLSVGLLATRRFKSLLVHNSASSSATVILSFLLIPQYGLFGAAWAMLGADLIYICVILVVLFRLLRDKRRTLDETPPPTGSMPQDSSALDE